MKERKKEINQSKIGIKLRKK